MARRVTLLLRLVLGLACAAPDAPASGAGSPPGAADGSSGLESAPAEDAPVSGEFRDRYPGAPRVVAGVETRVIRRGAGRPVVFVHGGGTWSYSFRHQLEHASDSFETIVFDLPGHGDADARDPEQIRYDRPATTAFITGLLDQEQLDAPVIVGHSWGGGFALDVALEHPERIAGLVLIASSGLDVPDHPDWELLADPQLGPVVAQAISPDTVRDSLLESFDDPALVTEVMVEEVYRPFELYPSRRSELQQYAQHLEWATMEPRLARLRIPTLVIWGAGDRYLPVDQASRLAGHIEGARLAVLDHAGHNVHEERPAEVNALLDEFVEAL